MLSVCVTHDTPMIPTAWFDTELALGEYRRESPHHISKLSRYWDAKREVTYGVAGSYAVPALVSQIGLPDDNLIRITSFRKAVVSNPVLIDRPRSAGMGFMTPAAAFETRVEQLCPAGKNAFLVSPPVAFKSGVVMQYAAAHKIGDLISYISLAHDMGILDNKAVERFFCGRHLIQGGIEIGVFPCDWVCAKLRVLGELGGAFLDRYEDRIKGYDRYQVRALGFLSERLGSFFLLDEIRRAYPMGVPSDVFGELITVTHDGNYVPGIADPDREVD